MITEHDLQEAIAECEGQRNPSSNTCLKLAAFYTIRDKMYPSKEQKEQRIENIEPVFYSKQSTNGKVEYESKTEFGKVVYGMDVKDFISVMDELMTTLKVLSPKLYDGVMRKLSDEY